MSDTIEQPADAASIYTTAITEFHQALQQSVVHLMVLDDIMEDIYYAATGEEYRAG